jgi:acyl carrier protein
MLRRAASRRPAETQQDVEELLLAEVAEILRVPVSAGDDFLEIGGNSLSAVVLADRLASKLGHRVSIELVFDAPSIRALADAIWRQGLRARGACDEPSQGA